MKDLLTITTDVLAVVCGTVVISIVVLLTAIAVGVEYDAAWAISLSEWMQLTLL